MESQVTSPRRFWPPLIALMGLLYCWGVGVAGLDRFPKVHEDEPWIAAPGYTFWERGVFGMDLFAGFYGMERHYYPFPPVFSLLVGGALHLFGLGLFQARLMSLTFGLLILALTYCLGASLFSRWHGALAVVILIGWRIAVPTSHLHTGIPLLDVARVARYDVAVAAFGLAALLVLVRAKKCSSLFPSGNHRFLASGVLAALSFLSHLYGMVWLPAVLISTLILLGRRALRLIAYILVGFMFTLLPWLLFVASGWEDFQHQFRAYSQHTAVLSVAFYQANWLRERLRYTPLVQAVAGQTLGIYLGLLGFTAGITWLAWSAIKRRNRSAALGIASVGILTMVFTLAVSVKTFTYLVVMWPLLALVVAAGGIVLGRLIRSRLGQWALVVILVLALAEGWGAVRQAQEEANRTTPYRFYVESIAAQIPPTSRVLALQHWWFGLAGHTADYRSLLVPINLTRPQYSAQPVTFGEAARLIAPDIVLLDQHMQDFLAETFPADSPFHTLYGQVWDYLNSRHARLISEVNDAAYGKTIILQLDPSP